MKDLFENRYFRMTKKMLWICGLWPYQTFYQKLFLRTLAIVSVGFSFISEVYARDVPEIDKSPLAG